MSATETSPLERMSVNEIIRLHPRTVDVFNRFHIDACCGGEATAAEAAQRDGAGPKALLAALRETIGRES
jgi:iron-sulfur cluster repair protein YtfE (RIC family)